MHFSVDLELSAVVVSDIMVDSGMDSDEDSDIMVDSGMDSDISMVEVASVMWVGSDMTALVESTVLVVGVA